MAYPQKGEVLSNRYQVAELLGEGAMGRVYKAQDLTAGGPVAVKIMKAGLGSDEILLKRFEREILTLKKLAHPDILNYIDHGRHGETDYLVVELLVGAPLNEYKGEFLGDADRVMLIGSRLARAFASAHSEGVIHRDIKPGNIHIADNGEPRILDYGLARWVAPDDGVEQTIEGLTRTDAIMGTIPYMSPEQLRAERVDRRSDIFSLAVLLYELAAGRRPFDGGSVTELYRDIEKGDPPSFASLDARLGSPSAQAMEAVLRRALHPVAGQRLQTMDELAEGFEKAVDLASSLPKDASIAILLPPQLVTGRRHAVSLRGRDEPLERYAEQLAVLDEGIGSLVSLQGPAGIGRSSVADEMLRMAHARGCLCLAATLPRRGAENAEHPAAIWLRRAAEVFPGSDDLRETAAMFAADGGGSAGGEGGRPQRRGQRIFSAITSLAARMPLALFLEDVHNADAALLRLLQRIAASAQGVGFSLVLTRRTDFAPEEQEQQWFDQLYALPGWEGVDLGPLSSEAIQELIQDAYPGIALGRPLLERLIDRSGGNPSFVHAILRLLEERGALQRVGVDWRLGGDTVIPEVPQARSVVDERLATVEEDDRELLAAAAVLGTDFQQERLVELLGWDAARVADRLRWLDKRRQLVLVVAEGYRFDQRITRDVLIERLDPERLAALHRRAGETLAAQLSDDAPPLLVGAAAEHFLAAGLKNDALPLILRTAEGLKGRNAPDDAIPWLRRGLHIVEQALEKETVSESELLVRQAELELELGEMLFAVARHKEALEHLERARGLAADCERKDLEAKSLILLSKDYLARGDMLQSERKARDARRLTRRAKLDTEHALAISMEAQALSRSGELDDAEELWLEAGETLEEQGRVVEAAEVWFRLGNQYMRTDRYDAAEEHYRKALGGVDEQNDPRLHARILNALGGTKMMVSAMPEAIEFLERALEIRRRIGARRGVAATQHNIAYCHYMLGDLARAEAESAQVIELRREMGDAAGVASAQRNRAEALHDLGRLEEALTEAQEALAKKRELEDLGYIPSCLLLVGECELTLGRAGKAREAFREVLRDFKKVKGKVILAEYGALRCDWLSGNIDDLGERTEALVKRFDPSGIGFSDSYAIYYWCLRLLREAGRDAAELRAAAETLGRKFSDDPPPHTGLAAALGLAELAAASGDRQSALEEIERAGRAARIAGLGNWTWRLPALRAGIWSEGSPEWEEAIRESARAIRAASDAIREPALREAYLAQRERSRVLEQEKQLPEEELDATIASPSGGVGRPGGSVGEDDPTILDLDPAGPRAPGAGLSEDDETEFEGGGRASRFDDDETILDD